MLVLSRRTDESIRIGEDIRITVLPSNNARRVRVGIEAPAYIRIRRGETHEPDILLKYRGFARFWSLFAVSLPRRERSEIFEPLFFEFLEDYLLERRRFTGRLDRGFLGVAFTFRTGLMMGRCLAAAIGGRTLGPFFHAILRRFKTPL